MLLCQVTTVTAQDKIVNPDISYAGNPRNVTIGGLAVTGIEGYEITDAIKRYWRHGLFSEVSIAADSLVGDKVYLHVYLKARPRVSTINYIGVKKSERTDLEQKLGLLKGAQITPNMISRAKILAKKYFDDKGFNNAEIVIRQREDVSEKNKVILDIDIDKKEKMKIHEIIIDGNAKLPMKKIKGTLFSKGALSKTNEAGKLYSFFKAKKYTPERYKEDKENLINKYNEYGYRDATILEDSVSPYDDKHVNVYIKVDEGQKYYIRNITWVGNTVYNTDQLSAVLGMRSGDVYNQKLMKKPIII